MTNMTTELAVVAEVAQGRLDSASATLELGGNALLQGGHTYTQHRDSEVCEACAREQALPEGEGLDWPEDCTCNRDAITGSRGFTDQGEAEGLGAWDLRNRELQAMEDQREEQQRRALERLADQMSEREAQLWVESGLSGLLAKELRASWLAFKASEASERAAMALAAVNPEMPDYVQELEAEWASKTASWAEAAQERADVARLEAVEAAQGRSLSRYYARHDLAIMANTYELIVGANDVAVTEWLTNQAKDTGGRTEREIKLLVRLGTGDVETDRDVGYSYESCVQALEDKPLSDWEKPCTCDEHECGNCAAKPRLAAAARAVEAARARETRYHKLAQWLRAVRSAERRAAGRGDWGKAKELKQKSFTAVKLWYTNYTESLKSHGAGDHVALWYLTREQVEKLWALNERRDEKQVATAKAAREQRVQFGPTEAQIAEAESVQRRARRASA